MPPKNVVSAKPKPKPKAVKARRIIPVGAGGEGGAAPSLPLRTARVVAKRQLKKPLSELYTKIAEKSTVDISQVGWG